MLRFIVSILFLFLPCTLFLGGKSSDNIPDSAERTAASDVEAYASLYRSMQLEGVVNWKAFRQAVAGYYKIDNRKREVLTLIDFSRPSTAKRLFVFDMRERKVLFSSVVSHGKNSGDNYATSFSNEYGSYKSSLGFYLTESTYQGKNGYSLILNGLEKGINVPQKLSRPIIDAIKGGSVMYIYAETPDYLAHSSVLKDADGL